MPRRPRTSTFSNKTDQQAYELALQQLEEAKIRLANARAASTGTPQDKEEIMSARAHIKSMFNTVTRAKARLPLK
jgi:hypothetical protein